MTVMQLGVILILPGHINTKGVVTYVVVEGEYFLNY